MFSERATDRFMNVPSYLHRMPSCPTCMKRLRALRAHVTYVPWCLRALLASLFTCLYLPNVPS